MRIFVPLLAIAGFCCAGCNNGPTKPKDPVYPVAGIVKYKDTPLDGATLTFTPADNTFGFTGTARTDKEGRYSVVDMHGNKGLVAGEFKVVVSRRLMPDGSPVPENDKTPPIESPASESLPPHLSSPDVSEITITVTKEKADYNFEFK